MELESVYKKSKLLIVQRIEQMRKNFEQMHKAMLGYTFECAGKCYSNTNSLSETKACIDKCTEPHLFIHGRLDGSLKKSCTVFDKCTEACHRTKELEFDERTKSCIKRCTNNSIEEFNTIERQILDEYKKISENLSN